MTDQSNNEPQTDADLEREIAALDEKDGEGETCKAERPELGAKLVEHGLAAGVYHERLERSSGQVVFCKLYPDGEAKIVYADGSGRHVTADELEKGYKVTQ